MKTFVIGFVALFAVVASRSVIDNVDGKKRNLDDKIDNRIIGGKSTTIEQHPHMIGLGQIYYKQLVCGGAILSPTTALTAASCKIDAIDTSTYFILAGSTWKLGHEDPKRQKRELTKFLKHERFDGAKYSINNIAVMFWKEPLTFGANVRAIRIPAANAPLPYGKVGTFTGYGYSGQRGGDSLQAITLPVVTNEVCNREWEGSIQPDQFCAGKEGDEDHGASSGDYGGPLVHNNNIIGIMSRSFVSFGLDVYTNVALFNDWITKNSK